MRRFSRRPGIGNSILRSSRPGRRSAGSSVSARLVHMITLTLTDWSKPSICVSSSIRMRCTSRSAPVCGHNDERAKHGQEGGGGMVRWSGAGETPSEHCSGARLVARSTAWTAAKHARQEGRRVGMRLVNLGRRPRAC
eukprot:6191194-Pleurochrysis_carterae.AAC.1